jgi:hypothetical protein
MSKLGFFAGAAVFSVMVFGGMYAGSRSWSGVVYLTDGTIGNNTRNPAAINREIDFTKLDGSELITATQQRLVTAAKVIVKEGLVGVELGHFVTRDSNGRRSLACDGTYNRMTLRFDAEGIASAGEKPSMEIDAPCQTSPKDVTSIEAVWVPVAKILETRAVNSELDYFEGVKFKFIEMNGSWPVSWSLQSVRLYNNQEPGREVSIGAREMHELRAKPVVMNWMQARAKK